MRAKTYLDFDLLIQEVEGGYKAQARSPAGEATVDFSLPFSDQDREILFLRVGPPRLATRRIDSPEVQAAKGFGQRLFSAVFAKEILSCLRNSIDEAKQKERGLRIRLRLTDVPKLADLPWEFLYDSALNRFLALSVDTPVVRYLDLPERMKPLLVTPPLRVLVMIPGPIDYPKLDVEKEWSNLRAALEELQQRGLVSIELLQNENASLPVLQRRLRLGAFHIFHFIGHGGFDQAAQEGALVFEGEGRRGRLESSQNLGVLLHDHRSLRLAVLNACEGARSSATDPFSGAAQTLVLQGLPATIAMQFAITDKAAITFAREFYESMADGYPVDAAVSEARKAIFQYNSVEWGTPVLHLRAPDGQIFNVQPPAPARTDGVPPSVTGPLLQAPAGLELLKNLADRKPSAVEIRELKTRLRHLRRSGLIKMCFDENDPQRRKHLRDLKDGSQLLDFVELTRLGERLARRPPQA